MAKADELKVKIGLSGPPLERIDNAPPNIPDHEMVRRIGQGSYGEVWLARNAVGTWRAVKVVYRAHFKDERPYEREFTGIQKYEPISRTNEGLVDVLQIGRNDAEGYFYYVMELADSAEVPSAKCQVSGNEQKQSALSFQPDTSHLTPDTYIPKTLAWEIRSRGRLTVEECITLGLTLNLALGHLHRSGLIHRDIKPSNIIFVNGVAKLADIGLVTDLADAQSFVGTEGFIPPEGPNSPQADLYALGKVLYEASMGKDRQEFPEPLSGLGLDAESKTLMELNAVLLRACAPNPKQRYQSAEEMNADLALLHSGSSVKDKHALERRLKVTRRVSVAIVAVMALGVVPYYLAIKQAHAAEAAAKNEVEQRQRAEANEEKAQTEATKSQQVAQYLKDILEGVGSLAANGRDTAMLKAFLDRTAGRVSKQLADQPDVEAELYYTIGRTYLQIGDSSKAEAMEREALRIRRSLFGETNELVAASLLEVARCLTFRGKQEEIAEAEGALRQALIVQEKQPTNDFSQVAASKALLAETLTKEGKLTEADAAAREALALRRQLFGDEHTEVARSLENLGMVFCAQGKLNEAEDLVRQALAMKRRLVGNECFDVAISLGCLAEVLQVRGKLAEAEAAYREQLEMFGNLYWNDSDYSKISRINLAMVLWQQGKTAEEESLIGESIAIHRMHEYFEDELIRMAEGFVWLARVLSKQNHSQAVSAYREAVRLYRMDSEQGARNVYVPNALAWLLATCPNPEVRDGESALNFAKRAVSATNRKRADFVNTLAAAHAEAGEFTNAVSVQKEALALLAEELGDADEETKRGYTSRLKLYESNTPYRER